MAACVSVWLWAYPVAKFEQLVCRKELPHEDFATPCADFLEAEQLDVAFVQLQFALQSTHHYPHLGFYEYDVCFLLGVLAGRYGRKTTPVLALKCGHPGHALVDLLRPLGCLHLSVAICEPAQALFCAFVWGGCWRCSCNCRFLRCWPPPASRATLAPWALLPAAPDLAAASAPWYILWVV